MLPLLTTYPPPARYSGYVGDSRALGAGREHSIVDMVFDVLRRLDAAPASARVRELRAQARTYDLATKRWTVCAPTGASLDAMFDLVSDLRRKTMVVSSGDG